MTRFNLFLFLTFVSTSIVSGQNCDCESNFQWVKKTFEENDAGFEGVWQQGIYTLGIVKRSDAEYTGFIIEADGVYWKQGQVKLKIDTKKPENNTVYYMKNHSEEQYNAELLSKNFLQIDDMTFKRLYPVYPKDSLDTYFKSNNAQNPYIERISDNTLLLRIPTFGGSRQEIDSLIAANKSTILETENLIIDIRNNGGGNDGNFQEILPLLYTNPIRTMGVEYLSTKLNNQRMLFLLSNAEELGLDDDGKKWFKTSYDTLESKLGQFVNLRQESVIINKYDTIYTYPKNVGIIINEYNASSAEEFLLEARQSKKVKLFGTTTFGAIDISNMYFVDSPCKEFQLGYCLTKRLWLPDMALDQIGIQPDCYIDKSIPPQKWIEYVDEMLNENQ
ncbi:MAG: S41 family peptidase [Dysgonamonadaceae bacterium]|jgi:hypothetical protein|nr:S41 family peptidase [Dysgonamonadaceae bacterium]